MTISIWKLSESSLFFHTSVTPVLHFEFTSGPTPSSSYMDDDTSISLCSDGAELYIKRHWCSCVLREGQNACVHSLKSCVKSCVKRSPCLQRFCIKRFPLPSKSQLRFALQAVNTSESKKGALHISSDSRKTEHSSLPLECPCFQDKDTSQTQLSDSKSEIIHWAW